MRRGFPLIELHNYSDVPRQAFSLYVFPVSKNSRSEAVSAAVVQALKEERLRQDRSIYWVAKKSGLSQQMISYVERGMRVPTLVTLVRIADALEVDLSVVLRNATNA